MIRKSKSLVLITVSFFAILGFLFQSCEKDEIDYKLDIPEEYNEVGKLHNQGLDFTFRKMKKESIALMQENENSSLKSTKTLDYKSLAHQGTLEFCKTNKKLKDNYQICKNALNFSQSRLKSAGLKSISINDLSQSQVELITQISETIGKKYSKNDLDKLKMNLNEINQSAAMNLTKEEAAVIYSATSTAYNSYQYWMKNYKKWYFALNYPEILEKYKEEELNNLQLKNGSLTLKSANWYDDTWDSVENWWDNTSDELENWWEEDGEEITDSDIEGAIGGALGGAYAGSAAGGVGALPGAAGGAVIGGLGASAGKAVTQMWN